MSSRPATDAVFDPREARYHTFRIPAALAAPSRDPNDHDPVLLAFCEGRLESADDSGPIELVLRRSYDGGRTWQPLQVVSAAKDKTCGNPVPILDPGSGDIVLLSVRNGARTDEQGLSDGSADAEDSRRIWSQRSADLGATWSEPVEITEDVKLPGWGWYATGPCHGIALQHGSHPGRLVVPANHTVIPPAPVSREESARYSGGHCLISDDGGRSWRIGFSYDTDDDLINANETCVAELPDGRLIFNARNHKGTGGTRVQAVSQDGGETLAEPYGACTGSFTRNLQDSMISVGETVLLSTGSQPDRRS